jgi:hypothetical protein
MGHNAAVRYAFNVIRAFAPGAAALKQIPRLTLVMKSFELPDDTLIKKYIDACVLRPRQARKLGRARVLIFLFPDGREEHNPTPTPKER